VLPTQQAAAIESKSRLKASQRMSADGMNYRQGIITINAGGVKSKTSLAME